MKQYTLFNKETSKRLEHPRLKTPWCGTLEEAHDMLEACHEHIKIKFPKQAHLLLKNFIIVDVETEEEVTD